MKVHVLLCSVLASLLPGPAPVGATGFTSSNLQLLHGYGFDDRLTGANSHGGRLTTLTFENLLLRDWGDSYLFIDVNHGKLIDFSGDRRDRPSQAYAEWQPRLSLGNPGSSFGGSVVRDVFVAGQLNAGDDGFRAGLIGLGVDFTLPGFTALGANLYRRDDSFNDPTAQLTVFWSARLGGVDSAWSTEGFVDIAGTDNDGTDVMFQPQLLADLGIAFSGKRGRWYAGIEWYYHHNDALTTSAPQLMIKRRLP